MSRKRITTIRRIVANEIECSPKVYRRAAAQRLEVARFLLISSRYHLDAIYLAGYAAECALKSLILARTPRSKWIAVSEEIGSGAKAHNMDFLVGVLKRKQCIVPADVAASLELIKLEWTTNLRYVGAVVPRIEAENFLDHIELVCEWAERSE